MANYRQFDGLFRCDAHQLRNKPSIESLESFMPDHLLEAIEAVAVHQLADVGTGTLNIKI